MPLWIVPSPQVSATVFPSSQLSPLSTLLFPQTALATQLPLLQLYPLLHAQSFAHVAQFSPILVLHIPSPHGSPLPLAIPVISAGPNIFLKKSPTSEKLKA